MILSLVQRSGGLRAAALATVLLLAAGGCGHGGAGSSPRTGASPDGAPDFDGPWAAEFTEYFTEASAEFVRAILVDELISDQELSETRDRFSECLMAFGITDITFEPNGAFAFEAPDGAEQRAVEKQVRTCSDESGEDSVGALHSWVRRNPQNLDDDTIVAACLVRREVVDPSFSAEDYVRADGDLPFLDDVSAALGDVAFTLCLHDPLGLFEDGSVPGA